VNDCVLWTVVATPLNFTDVTVVLIVNFVPADAGSTQISPAITVFELLWRSMSSSLEIVGGSTL